MSPTRSPPGRGPVTLGGPPDWAGVGPLRALAGHIAGTQLILLERVDNSSLADSLEGTRLCPGARGYGFPT